MSDTGFQLSGLYFYGSGARVTTNYGGDRRNTGGTAGRLRPDGTIVPRNNFVGRPLHRVDLRIQQRFRFGGRAAIDGILEVFNLFNHENYGSYTTAESNAQLRDAVTEHECRVSTADAAVRVPGGVLTVFNTIRDSLESPPVHRLPAEAGSHMRLPPLGGRWRLKEVGA